MLKLILLTLLVLTISGCNRTNRTTPADGLAGMPSDDPGIATREQPKVTLESIAKMSGDVLEDTIYGQALAKVNWNEPTEKKRIAALSDGEKIIYMTMAMEGEVFNGGFDQYFCNTGGELAVDTVKAYRKIGASKHADLVARAVVIAAKEVDLRKSMKISPAQLKAFASSYNQTKLTDLDDVFYALDKKEVPRTIRVRYIRKHASGFVER